jgi:hypothetical protein
MSEGKPVRLKEPDKLNACLENLPNVLRNARQVLRNGDLIRVTFHPPWSLLVQEDYFLVDSVGKIALRGESLGFFADHLRVGYRFLAGRGTGKAPHLASIQLIARGIEKNSLLVGLLKYLLGEIKRYRDWFRTNPLSNIGVGG